MRRKLVTATIISFIPLAALVGLTLYNSPVPHMQEDFQASMFISLTFTQLVTTFGLKIYLLIQSQK